MSTLRKWHEHGGPLLDHANGFDVIDCVECRFKHIVPIPSSDQLEEVYRNEYYSVEKPLYLERVREDLDWWELVYRERYDSFEELLPADRRRILDVGSGPGYFLLHGTRRGWHALGIEPSKQAAAHSRELDLDIVEEFLTPEVARSLGSFDVVHMSEVLEHVPNPIDMLRIAWTLLNPGGLLCVVVPNDYNPIQHALRNARGYTPWWVAPPHHINYFDFESLGQLLTSCGFRVSHREATFPIDVFLLMGDNYVGNDELGRRCHAKRKAFEQTLAVAGFGNLKRQVYKSLASAGIGREALMIGVKTKVEPGE